MRLFALTLLLAEAVSGFLTLQAGDAAPSRGLSSRRSPSRLLNMLAPSAPILSLEAAQDAVKQAMDGSDWHRKITLLGSTGSIGTQTLDIVRECPKHFSVKGLAAGSNVELLSDQVAEFRPEVVALFDESKVAALEEAIKQKLPKDAQMPKILAGMDGVCACASWESADVAVTGVVGCAGLLPTVAAIEAGKDIALANKETLIAAGPVILPLLRKHGVRLLPADSEHSAIFQSLQGVPPNGMKKILLTASGGAFRDWKKEDLKNVKLEDALKHPNWSMGAKITIDSATLMNKGLEVIEAHYLFGCPYDDIQVVVHPQSIIHSMVETQDSSVIAQLGWPDMRLPLLYSMSWPHRVKMPYDPLDFFKLKQMTFMEPDFDKYPCLRLAYEAGRAGGTMPAALNAANEQAVELFRGGKIHFTEIPKVIESVMDAHKGIIKTADITLQDILDTDAWARDEAKTFESKMVMEPAMG
mmetsp:Transcript_249/g.611  ORF Transcript_249/g.611 Transcript_249/m.611 type:complete len:470 (+) Transcript_249:96-1505(+)